MTKHVKRRIASPERFRFRASVCMYLGMRALLEREKFMRNFLEGQEETNPSFTSHFFVHYFYNLAKGPFFLALMIKKVIFPKRTVLREVSEVPLPFISYALNYLIVRESTERVKVYFIIMFPKKEEKNSSLIEKFHIRFFKPNLILALSSVHMSRLHVKLMSLINLFSKFLKSHTRYSRQYH